MLTGQFLNRLCGSDIPFRLRVDRILSGLYSHPVSLAALENRPLRQGAKELFGLFFGHIVFQLMGHEPGTAEWRAILAEERAFFEVTMARSRAMHLPTRSAEKVARELFKILENLKPIGEQLKEVLDRIGREMIDDAFGYPPSEN